MTSWRQLGPVQRRVLLGIHALRSRSAHGNVHRSVVGLHRRGLVTIEVRGPNLPLTGFVIWSPAHAAWLELELTEDGEVAVVQGLLSGDVSLQDFHP